MRLMGGSDFNSFLQCSDLATNNAFAKATLPDGEPQPSSREAECRSAASISHAASCNFHNSAEEVVGACYHYR